LREMSEKTISDIRKLGKLSIIIRYSIHYQRHHINDIFVISMKITRNFPTVCKLKPHKQSALSAFCVRQRHTYIALLVLFLSLSKPKVCLLIFFLHNSPQFNYRHLASPSICVPIADELHCWISESGDHCKRV
jgi:hypothetical protein